MLLTLLFHHFSRPLPSGDIPPKDGEEARQEEVVRQPGELTFFSAQPAPSKAPQSARDIAEEPGIAAAAPPQPAQEQPLPLPPLIDLHFDLDAMLADVTPARRRHDDEAIAMILAIAEAT